MNIQRFVVQTVDELDAKIQKCRADFSPTLAFIFASPFLGIEECAEHIRAAGCPAFGCTMAGEILTGDEQFPVYEMSAVCCLLDPPVASLYDRIKTRVNMILNTYPNPEPAARGVRYFLAIFILSNTLAIIISTIPDLPLSFRYQLFAIISICLTVFGIEYVLRLWSCTQNPTFFGRVKDRVRYAAGIYMIIDLISIIPIIFPFVIPGNYTLLHVFRLLSIFKLVRYTRHSDALQLLQRVVFKKREIISFLVIFLVFEILFASTIMYLVENAAQPDNPVYPQLCGGR